MLSISHGIYWPVTKRCAPPEKRFTSFKLLPYPIGAVSAQLALASRNKLPVQLKRFDNRAQYQLFV